MDVITSPRKKIRSPVLDTNPNSKTSITCTNVPEGLFDAAAAKKHFSKFGRVQRIRLIRKRLMCIVEYEQSSSVERAVLNAGAFDGFMFDVVRTKPRVRRRSSKKDDDPDWLPDSDVEEELSAMSGTPVYRVSRQKPMEIEPDNSQMKQIKRVVKNSPMVGKTYFQGKGKSSPGKAHFQEKKSISQPASGMESPVLVTAAQTSMSTAEAAAELNQLRSRTSLTSDEQWRTLDARDRILRAWGGAGSRVKVGGATIGTCPDMCPEKELLHRQAEHQVMTLETVPETDGQLDPAHAVKQYSRSSADQEMPMCYELRPAPVLMRTCAYLLNEVADTKRQVTLADWFHFMWDRLRGIRKDITQQALCCSESICLVEMCARFHAHCAARLADLEYSQFDQKLNTDNLTKCLQTLKHMYADVGPENKPHEAEFRGYIALLNLGDANFLWEIKQLPKEIQKAEPITFAIQVFNALDNNNYVRFFRLVRDKATYLQACILLRYFNDVRARALARIVKAYAPRGGSRYPAEELMNSLAFESTETMKSFINHYGLRIARDESELSVILDRNQFIEDMDPFPIARAIHLIESKGTCTVGEVIAGGQLPSYNSNYSPYSSFTKDGKLKDSALVAEDQGYNTVNDSNKKVQSLKEEIQKLSQSSSRYYPSTEPNNVKTDTHVSPGKISNEFVSPVKLASENKGFSFQPAIPVAPFEVINNSPENILNPEKVFSFSKPNLDTNVIVGKDADKLSYISNQDNNFFSRRINENVDPSSNSSNIFKNTAEKVERKSGDPKVLFEKIVNKNVFTKADEDIARDTESKDLFKNIDTKIAKSGGNIFASAALSKESGPSPQNIFGSFNKATPMANANNIFTRVEKPEKVNSVFQINGDVSKNLSPGSLFKSAISVENMGYSIFQTKNKPSSVAENIFNSVNAPNNAVYDFNENDESQDANNKLQQLEEESKLEEDQDRKVRERIEEEKKQELRRIEEQRKEEERRQEQERKRLEEIKHREEIRKREEEKKQEDLKKKLEAEKKEAELKKKAEEERKFKERVELESSELCSKVIDEVRIETVNDILLEEVKNMKHLTNYAENVTEEIWTELSDEIISLEIKAEKFWTNKLMKKWFYVWRKQLIRNTKRRNLLEDTPVWITEKTPIQEAAHLKRVVESAALKRMNAFHRGYVFTGELPKLPSPEPYNIMEIIKSSLLKRMKQIQYPYDKCFFWKITLVSPSGKWMSRKIELEKWILEIFSDQQNHETSETLIHVGKQSWNNLMDFAISVSLLSQDDTKKKNTEEALEGSNGLLFYVTENDDSVKTIEDTLKHKYPYQKVPVAIVMPKMKNKFTRTSVEQALHHLRDKNIISDFKIFDVEPENVFTSLNLCTKTAMKWLAKKYPLIPPLEVDYLKSLCERYLGSEVWARFKSEKDCRMSTILKDLPRLVKCYNIAVDKLAHTITNEDVLNYSLFPLEFKQYLNHNTPYPKPYEFIPACARNSSNISVIRDTLNKLKLPDPSTEFQPMSVVDMQDQIHKYCSQIGWFDDPEQVVCKIVAVLPNQFSDMDMPPEDFTAYFEHYDLVDILNKIVNEKINSLNNFENCYAVYEKTTLEKFRDMHWLYDIEVLKTMKHKISHYEDGLDILIEAKKRKIELDSMDYLMIEENDCTMFEENLKASDISITKYSNCNQAVKQLEEQIEKESEKSRDLENLLRAALSNVN